jgi:hypothetical protein
VAPTRVVIDDLVDRSTGFVTNRALIGLAFTGNGEYYGRILGV